MTWRTARFTGVFFEKHFYKKDKGSCNFFLRMPTNLQKNLIMKKSNQFFVGILIGACVYLLFNYFFGNKVACGAVLYTIFMSEFVKKRIGAEMV